jgi:CRISPR-associated protein Cas2
MYLLVTYDIVSDKRRRKVDKLLSEYGFRVNYSVFELEIGKKADQYNRLKKRFKDSKNHS